MTTAHRPTFDPARGRETQRGPAYHQRLLPAHTHLKQRQQGQGGVGGLPSSSRRDLRTELLAAEAAVRARKSGGAPPANKQDGHSSDIAAGEKRKMIEAGAADANGQGEGEDPESKRRRLILEEAHDVDAATSGSDSNSDSEDSESDDEDEEAELMRELAKIKAERAAQREKEEADKAAREQERREEEIATGNPLLNPGSSGGGGEDFGVRRRWDDDVVFRNQARGTEGKGRGRAFVNDLLRSDFHKKFMAKYVR